jgi:hypothetical protein
MPVKKDSLTVTGPTKQFTRIADSGNELTGVFCPECGVRIYHVPKSVQDVLSLKPGTLDDTSWLRPGYFIWMKSGRAGFLSPTASKRLRNRLRQGFPGLGICRGVAGWSQNRHYRSSPHRIPRPQPD